MLSNKTTNKYFVSWIFSISYFRLISHSVTIFRQFRVSIMLLGFINTPKNARKVKFLKRSSVILLWRKTNRVKNWKEFKSKPKKVKENLPNPSLIFLHTAPRKHSSSSSVCTGLLPDEVKFLRQEWKERRGRRGRRGLWGQLTAALH